MDQFNTPWRIPFAATCTTTTESRVYVTFHHRIVDGAQIGKLAHGITRNFRKPAWLDEIPLDKLKLCIFDLHGDLHN